MKRGRFTGLLDLAKIGLLALVLTLCLALGAVAQEGSGKKITVFGSSVASGSGATNNQGYWAHLKKTLEPGGWVVTNKSKGGDTTVKIAPRFDPDLVPEKADYIFIGLSLANEGIRKGLAADKDRIYEQYRTGMLGLIKRMRDQGMRPVVGLCYPHSDYGAVEDGYIRRMNLLINTWDVPSANFLGAIGDGQGRWVKGNFRDGGHPNDAGHEEMFYAIVPSLFEAMAAGKPIPSKVAGDGFARIASAPTEAAPLSFHAEHGIHSHAVGFSFRSTSDGTLASARGAASSAIQVEQGALRYVAATGEQILAPGAVADGAWHSVVVSHRYALAQTQLFVDGRLAGAVAERLAPKDFVLGGPGPRPDEAAPERADYRDWVVYRAALNEDEVAALRGGALLQSSLEVYAPLRDAQFVPGKSVENRAQSMSSVVVGESVRIIQGERK